MKFQDYRRFVLHLIASVICLLRLSSSESHSPSEKCKQRLLVATVQPTLQFIGVEMMRKYERGNDSFGFVYSELKIFHKLIQLLAIGSESARSNIKTFMNLESDTKCDDLYCGAFSSIIDDIKKSEEPNFDYMGMLCQQKNRTVKSEITSCTNKITKWDFENWPTDEILNFLEYYYDMYSEGTFYEFLNTNWDRRADFYLLSGLLLKNIIFKSTWCYRSVDLFIDLDGVPCDLSWRETRNHHWIGLKFMGSGADIRTIRLISGELNGRSIYYLIFHPLFTDEDTVSTKSKCLQEIFYNLREFINDTVSRRAHHGRNITSVAVPHQSFESETLLTHLMGNNLTDVLKPGQITNLYDDSTTVYELRSWEYFYNDVYWGCRYRMITEESGFSDYLVDSPFVFVLLDKATNIILKTGAYLRPSMPDYG